ncbi:hypothetical protein Vi05172_g2613 [Venturia inaequalis]|nr:hypothetical protein Vi05172_g2613 [Venturia inaequalis]
MRTTTNMLVAILISSLFYSMTLAVALPSLETTSTFDIKQTTNPIHNAANHLDARENCPKNGHGDKACGTCITLFEGSFYTGKSFHSCTAAHHCVTAESMGLAEFRSVRFSGSTNCRFARKQDCTDNALGKDVVENTELMEDLQDSLHARGFHSVECARPN